MKFFEKIFPFQRIPNWMIAIFSILCACAMYYYVSGREILETQFELNLDYTGVPKDLIITKGLESFATVRVKGPDTLIRAIPHTYLSQTINLSNIKRGINEVPVNFTVLPASTRAYNIIEVNPSQLTIEADTVLERSVPVRVILKNSLGNAITVNTTSLNPPTVTLSGPETIVSDIAYVDAVITPETGTPGLEKTQTVSIGTPNMVVASPSTVRVHYIITSGRTIVSRKCQIKITGDEEHEYVIEPSSIELKVEVPDAVVKDVKYLDQLQATVIVPPMMNIGETKEVSLRITLPDGMTQLNKNVDQIIITRKK